MSSDSDTRFITGEMTDFLPIAIGIADLSGNIIYINKKFTSLFGYTLNEIPNIETWAKLAYPDESYRKSTLEQWNTDISQALKEGTEAPKRIYKITCKNQEIKNIELSFQPIKNQLLVSFHDVTELLQLQNQLKQSEEKYRLIIDNLPSVVWTTSEQGKTVFISSNVEQVYGFTDQEIYEKGNELWIERIHPDDKPILLQSFRNLFEKNEKFDIEYRIKRKDNTWIWLHDQAYVTKEINGERYAYGVFSDITKRKQTELALQESEEKYRLLFESAQDSIFLMKDYIFIDCNTQTLKMFKCREDQIIGKPPTEFSPEYQPNNKRSDQQALNFMNSTLEGNPQHFEWTHRKLNGKEFCAEVKLNKLSLLQNDYILAIVRDISDRKKAEVELKVSEEKFRSLFEDNLDGIVIINDLAEIIECNQAYCDMLGYTKEELRNKTFYELTPKKWHRWEKEEIIDKHLVEFGHSPTYEKEYIHKDGHVFPIEVTAYQHILSSGEKTIWGMVRNISERKKAELQLQESEKKYREIIENANSAIVKLDLQGNITFFNEFAERLFQYKQKQILGRNALGTIVPYDETKRKKQIPAWWSKLLNNIPERQLGENWNITKSGEKIYLTWSNKPIYGINGEQIGIICIGTNITQQKLALQQLTENEAKYRSLFDNSSDSIFILEKGSVFIDCNEEATRLLGYPKEFILGKTPLFFSPEFQPDGSSSEDLIAKNDREVMSGAFLKFEWKFTRSDNETRITEISLTKYELLGKVYRQAIVHDITERKQNQREILNAAIEAEEKERTRVARDLHDGVSPILSALKLYSQTLIDCNDDELRQKVITNIEKTAEEAIISLSEISNNVSPHVLHNFGLGSALQNFIDRINETSKLQFKTEIETNNRLKEVFEVTLYRVIVELINNTLKHAQATQVEISLKTDKEISLIYKDNGKGFKVEESINRKQGMGLFNIINRVKSLNGNVTINSNINKGLHVQIHIPLNYE